MKKSAIIVGAGHNGLVCGCYLAKAGWKVTILERRHIVGGAAVTEEFHPGFRNSVASYTVSLLQPKIIQDLNLEKHGLKLLTRKVNNFVPQAKGEYLAFRPDFSRNQEEVAKFSEKDAIQLERYYQDLDAIVPVVKEMMYQTPLAVIDAGFGDLFKAFQLSRLFRQLTNHQKRFLTKLFTLSAAELLDEYFESDPVKALFAFDGIVGHYDSPYSPGTAYVLLHHLLGEVNGQAGAWGHAIGGMGAITQAMQKEAIALGITIETEAAVEQICLSKNKADLVVCKDGREFTADIVVANVNPKLLYLQLLKPEDLNEETLQHFENYKCQSGTFRMNVALSGLPEFPGSPPSEVLQGGIILAPNMEYMDRAYQDARQYGWSKKPIIEILIPSIVDDSLAPEGQHVASLFCQQFDPTLGVEWLNKREAAAKTVIETVDQYAPGFKSLVLAQQIHSPYDLEQKFGLIGGDIFHGRLSLEQLYSARPMLGMGQYKTDIENLYLCGAGTHPGGGVSGIPGHNAAREILKQE
ncbi:MAG: phytoene dehydrogenase-like protein [Candidatus Azotimanducaceae bacterium]|jgi:phytoene dehydrogenase-like protein